MENCVAAIVIESECQLRPNFSFLASGPSRLPHIYLMTLLKFLLECSLVFIDLRVLFGIVNYLIEDV